MQLVAYPVIKYLVFSEFFGVQRWPFHFLGNRCDEVYHRTDKKKETRIWTSHTAYTATHICNKVHREGHEPKDIADYLRTFYNPTDNESLLPRHRRYAHIWDEQVWRRKWAWASNLMCCRTFGHGRRPISSANISLMCASTHRLISSDLTRLMPSVDGVKVV